MNDKIYKGQIIKNYKEFCELQGEKPSTGNGKMTQLKRWEKDYTWTRKGHAYFISDVKVNPLATFDLEKLLLSYIYINGYEEEPCFLSQTEFLTKLGIVNPKFLQMVYAQHNLPFVQGNVGKIINNIFIYLMDIVERTLLSLHNQSSIIYAKTALIDGEEMELCDQEVWSLIKNTVKKRNGYNESEMYSKTAETLMTKLWNSCWEEERSLPFDVNKIIIIENPFNVYYTKQDKFKKEQEKVNALLKENLIRMYEGDSEYLNFIKSFI